MSPTSCLEGGLKKSSHLLSDKKKWYWSWCSDEKSWGGVPFQIGFLNVFVSEHSDSYIVFLTLLQSYLWKVDYKGYFWIIAQYWLSSVSKNVLLYFIENRNILPFDIIIASFHILSLWLLFWEFWHHIQINLPGKFLLLRSFY